MKDYKKHLISENETIKEVLLKLGILLEENILFVINNKNELVGSVTDGDVRRGLLNDFTISDKIMNISHKNPKFININNYSVDEIISLRNNNFMVIPVVNDENMVVNIINLRLQKSYLPIDAVIMAGGRGQRLRPLTDTIPKPLLKIGNKSIMEWNVARLAKYGIDDFWFSVQYLGNQIVDYFGDGKDKNISIQYLWEDEPLGTIGSVSKVNDFKHEHILVSNSDILTDLDYEAFYLDFLEKDADFAVATVPYNVSIPYAVLETSNGNILNFREKPTYTYFSNGGIYLMKRSVLEYIPKDKHYDATDLMKRLIDENKKVISYPLIGYWLDIGKHDDFEKAQNDINTIKF